jgi:hypothetical protein
MIVSAMYPLSSNPIPLWLPKKNNCRMIIREFGQFSHCSVVNVFHGWLLGYVPGHDGPGFD